MKNVIYFLLYIAVIICSPFVSAYDNIETHPKLTLAALGVYANVFPGKLTDSQFKWIKQGSIDEDTDPRYLNHYYNPVTGNGLTDLSEVPKIIANNFTIRSAKSWALEQKSISGDYSESAIYKYYREGNLEQAYLGVGHVLHLIQDMATPAHVRNDSHADGDPYEKWAKEFGVIALARLKYVAVENLDTTFDELAWRTNRNFVSRDSVDISKFNQVHIENEYRNNVEIGYLMGELDGKKYRIAYTRNPNSLKPEYSFDQDTKLNIDYWNLLYPEAVGYSAGVIDYFEREFAKIDQEKKQQQEELTLWQEVIAFTKRIKNEAKYNAQANLNSLALNFQQLAFVDLPNTYDVASQNVEYFAEANKEMAQITVTKATQSADVIAKKANVLGEKITNTTKAIIKTIPIKPQPVLALEPIKPESVTQDIITPVIEEVELPSVEEAEVQQPQNPNLPFIIAPGAPLIVEVAQEEAVVASTTEDEVPVAVASSTSEEKLLVKVESGPSQYTRAWSFLFRLSSSTDVAIIECKLDANPWQVCRTEFTLTNLNEGKHELLLRGTDSASTTGAINSYAWIIDQTRPSVTISQLEANSSTTKFLVSWIGTDPGNEYASGIKSYDIDYKVCETTCSVDNNSDWNHWLSATSATSSMFTANVLPGEKVYFRAFTEDNTLNSSYMSNVVQTKISAPVTLCNALPLNENGEFTVTELTSALGPYCLSVNKSAVIPAGQSLTVGPGVIIKLALNAGFSVYGQLDVVGEAGNPVIFTSYRDDTVGGDTNPENDSQPVKGDWYNLKTYVGGRMNVDRAVVKYGGYYNVYVQAATPGVKKKPLTYKLAAQMVTEWEEGAIYSYNGLVNVANSILRYNKTGVQSYGLTASLEISNSSITGNDVGAYRAYGPALIAQNNWWGSADGPNERGVNYSTGDIAYNGVVYTPWLTVQP